MQAHPKLRTLLLVTIALSLIPCLGLLELDLQRRFMARKNTAGVDTYNLPPPSVIRAFCFGFNELGADLLWIRTIAYFSDHLTTDHDLRYLERYLQNILSLDNHFKAIYRYGSAMMMSRNSRLTNDDVFAAIRVLEQAHRLFPDDYHFPLHLGAYYINDLRTSDKKQKALWRRIGADYIHRAALIGANIPWLPSLAANIFTEQGERDLAIQHLEEIYLTSQDESMRQQISAKLKHLQATKEADDLERAANAFNKSHKESRLSFIPPDLYALTGLPPLKPFDLKQLIMRE